MSGRASDRRISDQCRRSTSPTGISQTDRVAENAGWIFLDPPAGLTALNGHVSYARGAADAPRTGGLRLHRSGREPVDLGDPRHRRTPRRGNSTCGLEGYPAYQESSPTSSSEAATSTSADRLGASRKARAASRTTGEGACPVCRRAVRWVRPISRNTRRNARISRGPAELNVGLGVTPRRSVRPLGPRVAAALSTRSRTRSSKGRAGEEADSGDSGWMAMRTCQSQEESRLAKQRAAPLVR